MSGLMFHFRGKERVAIVGQWIEEVDSMDIDEGDRITHIRISYCFDGEQNPGNHVPSHCKVLSFAVSTLRGIRKDVLGRGSRIAYYRDCYTNALEAHREFCLSTPTYLAPPTSPRFMLTTRLQDGLGWSFRREYHVVQATYAPSSLAAGRKLQLYGLREPEAHLNRDVRRFLWTELDADGKELRLLAIEA